MTEQEIRQFIEAFITAYHDLEFRSLVCHEALVGARCGDVRQAEHDLTTVEATYPNSSLDEKYRILRANFEETSRQVGLEEAARALIRDLQIPPPTNL